MAGPSLLAFILVSKCDDHVPLYRLNEIFARMGADIPDTTMLDWCGGARKTLSPLLEKIETAIMCQRRIRSIARRFSLPGCLRQAEYFKYQKRGTRQSKRIPLICATRRALTWTPVRSS